MRKRNAVKALQILSTLVRNATFAIFSNKKLEPNATSSNCTNVEVAL